MRMILAIESAISGGSLSLINGQSELAGWIGSGNVAKAEELLGTIDQLLDGNDISLRALDMIAVSAGPGSFTGIRIGMATALGLKTGLGIPISSISALRAMAISAPRVPEMGTVTAAPVGRDQVCVQSFRYTNVTVSEITEPMTVPTHEFDRYLRECESRFVLHADLCESARDLPHVTNIGKNLAYVVGRACQLDPAFATAKPLFVSKGNR